MRFDEFTLLRMEHDTTVIGAVGDACAETGRFILLNEFLARSNEEYELLVEPYIKPYLKNTVDTFDNLTLVRHPLADRSWGFGPDQWTPRYLVTPYDVKAKLRRNYVVTFQTLAAQSDGFIKTAFCFLQELKLKFFPSGDSLNWFMIVICRKYNPKVLTKQNFIDMVRSYYKPETDVNAWTFIDLYEKAADKVWNV